MPDEMTGVGTAGSRTWILSVLSVITAPTAHCPHVRPQEGPSVLRRRRGATPEHKLRSPPKRRGEVKKEYQSSEERMGGRRA